MANQRNPNIFTRDEAALVAKTSTRTIRRWEHGGLPSFRVGRRVLIRRECLAAWLGVPESDLVLTACE